MTDDLFPEHLDLDTSFLNETYADDPETAIVMFENYLTELPVNLNELKTAYKSQDVDSFRKLVHKQKPAFSYVGLTDLSDAFQELQTKCLQVQDLTTYKDDIEKAFSRIEASTPLITSTLAMLRAI